MVKAMQKNKHEYKVQITYTEVHSVYVEAESYEEAEQIAEAMYHRGETEMTHFDTTVEATDEEN